MTAEGLATQIAGVVHAPGGTPRGIVLLTHGAGGNRDAPLLVALCDEIGRASCRERVLCVV